jgi:CheY-like chemotaxis protein
MKIIRKNPDRPFQKLLTAARQEGGWHGYRFSLSGRLDYEDLISRPAHIGGKLYDLRRKTAAFAGALARKSAPLTEGTGFVFPDASVVMLVRNDLSGLYEDLARQEGASMISLTLDRTGSDAPVLNADKSLFSAYDAMANMRRVRSIPLRRDRRQNGLIMIVEDDYFTSSYTANLLKKDYDVVSVRSGLEAMPAYIEHAPDLALLDIHMPGLDGHQTLRALRAIDPQTCVVMISADSAENQVMTATRDGAVGFLKKPFARDKLLETIQHQPCMKKFALSAGQV